MKRYRIMHIIGARPHFMKLAPISAAIADSLFFEEVIVHSGQHYSDELSENFIREFKLKDPDYRLGVGSGTHNYQIGQILLELDDILKHEHPDIVFVYGDTNTTAAGAIAAAKAHIPIAHIEAGLREWDKSIPEEINKLLTDAVSDLYFCPTKTAVRNLHGSGIRDGVYHVGDTVIDWISSHKTEIAEAEDVLDEVGVVRGKYCLLTCHRVANTNHTRNLREILTAATGLDMRVVFPMHPRTRMAAEKRNLESLLSAFNMINIAPLSFWRTQALVRNAKCVITDSGGLIKEAYYHRVPAVIVDKQTEWVEAVEEGWAVVAGPDAEAIRHAVTSWKKPSVYSGFLGEGQAALRILDHTLEYLKHRKRKDGE
jgi:UDP-N-acetylglucosamine 2-epimerase